MADVAVADWQRLKGIGFAPVLPPRDLPCRICVAGRRKGIGFGQQAATKRRPRSPICWRSMASAWPSSAAPLRERGAKPFRASRWPRLGRLAAWPAPSMSRHGMHGCTLKAKKKPRRGGSGAQACTRRGKQPLETLSVRQWRLAQSRAEGKANERRRLSPNLGLSGLSHRPHHRCRRHAERARSSLALEIEIRSKEQPGSLIDAAVMVAPIQQSTVSAGNEGVGQYRRAAE